MLSAVIHIDSNINMNGSIWLCRGKLNVLLHLHVSLEGYLLGGHSSWFKTKPCV